MAEDKVGAREVTWRQLMPWTHIFRGFGVTLDLNKLLLAAAGILVMFCGWWLLAVIFTASERGKPPPDWPGDWKSAKEARGDEVKAWELFRRARQRWNLLHEATDLDKDSANPSRYQVEDVADTLAEYNDLKRFDEYARIRERLRETTPPEKEATELRKRLDELRLPEEEVRRLRPKYALVGQVKPAGRLSVSPWTEDRGPNPYLLVTGQAGIPWEGSTIWDWLIRDQVPVMIEPLIKFVRPIIYFLSPRNDGFGSRFYFLLVTLWTLMTWSFFGGAITRIAAVQLARNESVNVMEALRFTAKRFTAYLTAPLFPLVFVFLVLIFLVIFGLFHMIPFVGDIFVDGLFWWLAVIAGLAMALALVCLPSWPLMSATVSAEGSDSWEAFSRAYSYIINRPWQCIWYALVAIAYGGVIVFFVGFMSSLSIYLAKWGVSAGSWVGSREPSFLFVYAPTSFGWRDLLMEGAQVDADEALLAKEKSIEQGAPVVGGRASRPLGLTSIGGVSRWDRINSKAYQDYLKTMSWWNTIGAVLVGFWLGLAFLFVLGFGYAYFWSASTIIYLLLRRDMDAAEMDEVYFEEDEYEAARVPPATTPPGAAVPSSPPGKLAQSLPVVEPPRPVSSPPLGPPPSPAPVAPPPVVSTPLPAPPVVHPPGTTAPASKPPIVESPSEAASPPIDKPAGEGTPPVL
jgi:hypothetical protein